MLDWLKTILGDSYTEDIDAKVSTEIGKNFVAKVDFNATNEAKKTAEAALKERDKQLEDLKASTGDAEALKATITELQAQNAEQVKANATAMKALKVDNAVELALVAAKAKNTTAVKALLGDMSKAELADDGTVKGLAEKIQALIKAEDSSFLFDTSDPTQTFSGLNPNQGAGGAGAAGSGAPGGGKAPKDMTYDELCAFLAKNPTAQLD